MKFIKSIDITLNEEILRFLLWQNVESLLLFFSFVDLFQVDNALSLIKIGALDGLGNNCIENTSLHDLIYLSRFQVNFDVWSFWLLLIHQRLQWNVFQLILFDLRKKTWKNIFF